MRQHGPQHVQGPKHVHVELTVHFGRINFLDAAQGAVARVVYYHVEVAQGANGVGYGLLYLLLVGYFADEAAPVGASFPAELVGLLLLAESGGYFVAFAEAVLG